MSKRSIKKLREEFENKYGFSAIDRKTEPYKMYWRKYKKSRGAK